MMVSIASGGCQCTAVRYEVDVDAAATLYACHCSECQKQSGSAFGLSLIIPTSAFNLTEGELKVWTSPIGGGKDHAFCSHCGGRIYHQGRASPDWISLKAGTLDEPLERPPVGNIWTRSAQPWDVRVPGDLDYPKGPEDFGRLTAAYWSAS